MSAATGWWMAREWHAVSGILGASAAEIDAIARRRLAWVLERAVRSPLNAQRLREAGVTFSAAGMLSGGDPVAALEAITPITKAELAGAGAAAVEGGRIAAGWHSSRSSGSTGEPLRVHYDERAWVILKYLVKWRARRACGLRAHHRIAILDACPPADEPRGPLSRLGRVQQISVLQPADRVAAALVAFRPDAIYALPSALLEAGLALGDGTAAACVRPRAIFTSGELLRPAVRRALAERFRAPVHDIYGMSETKEIAWECPAGGRHINADVVRLEVLDDAGNPLPPSEDGALVATLLVNRAMPLIRYRTSDRGAIDPEPCRCGIALPSLRVVSGRESEVLEIAGGERLSPYALTTAVEAVAGVLRYQIVQPSRDRLTVRVIPHEGADVDALRGGIQRALAALGRVPLHVEVELVPRLETGPRAKVRVVHPFRTPAAPDLISQP